MLMRWTYAIAAFFGLLAASAEAEEARLVPAAGSTLTYRLVTTTKTQDRTVVTGQIYAYLIASSDGTVAEGAIKPLALLFDCRGHEQEADCARVKTAPDVREENGFTVVPVPAAVADKLAAKSAFKLRAFIVEQRKAAYPTPARDAPSSEDLLDGDDPMIVATSMVCDPAALGAMTPLGKTPQATISCTNSSERSGGGVKPASGNGALSLDVSYQGEGRVSLPSGEWDVRKLSLKPTSSNGSTSSHTEIQFSDKLGAAVKTHSTVEALGGKFTMETDSELIAVSP
jgi:hypothetical protein